LRYVLLDGLDDFEEPATITVALSFKMSTRTGETSMNESTIAPVREQIEALYQNESRRIFATLIRLLGDFDLAEEALQEAFRAAMEQWHINGIPANPRPWLVSTGRFKAIDALRRRARYDVLLGGMAEQIEQTSGDVPDENDAEIEDDRLRLIFTCCHPVLTPEARIALTLREVCGLTTEAIASAFLVPVPTLAQRIVRAKAKIRDAHIPYEVPAREELQERLGAVLHVIYLVFNEGYSASAGDALTRPDLCGEALRLGRLLLELLPEPEVQGLLALMLLHESRRLTRATPNGDLVLLEHQDRSRWNRAQIREGVQLVEQALSGEQIGPYALQAAIAATHATAPTFADTDWNQIVELYDALLRAAPSPIVELNRAVAVAMQAGPAEALTLIEAILERGNLTEYHLAHAIQADLYRQLGNLDSARRAYQRALKLAQQEPERRFIEQRLAELSEKEAKEESLS
jgi:RNA polymerase sigma-70 factor (ECF subfamily)